MKKIDASLTTLRARTQAMQDFVTSQLIPGLVDVSALEKIDPTDDTQVVPAFPQAVVWNQYIIPISYDEETNTITFVSP